MDYFNYKGDVLYAEDVPVSKLAEKYGTPLYVYSQRTFVEHFCKIKNAFSDMETLICYSVKANSNLSVLNELKKEGAGFDIVSGGELYRALKVGADPKKIVYAGVGKTAEEINYALEAGILMFNVESVNELKALDKAGKKMNKIVGVALRINPDVDAHTHPHITTGTKETKFGIDMGHAYQLYRSAHTYKNLHIKGLHVHIGSQITSTYPYIETVKKVSQFIKDLQKEGVELEYLNLGGGFGIIYNEEKPSTADTFALAIKPYVTGLKLKLILEPGRFIIGNAAILVTKVIYNKKGNKKDFLITDAGMNDLIRPAMYEAYHKIIPVEVSNKKEDKELGYYDVVGPICESSDFLGKDRHLPLVKEGDLLAVRGAGAYGFSMSSNYNSRKRMAEVMVKGKDDFLIRERETFEDLVDKEKIIK
ncbi:MAG: diaminopimelate decarboxylase [bacterium]